MELSNDMDDMNGTDIRDIIGSQNRLVGKEVNVVLTEGFLYDGQLEPVAELDGSGNIVEQFVYGTRPNVPDYIVQGGVEYEVITDQVGSPELIVNTSTGAIAEQIRYDVWGNVASDSNPGFQPFGFAGGLYDQDTKLVRFGARDYDPQTGRWTAKDPILFQGGETGLYTYTGSDPINFVDPSGLYWQFTIGVNAFAGFGPFVGGGAAIGFSSTGQLLFQFQANASVGVGVFAGVGFQGGISHSKCDMGNGINVNRVLEGDVNAGLGIDGGLTTQGPFSSSPGPNDSVSGATGFPTNSYKAGVGVGAEASIGVTQVTTIAIPIIPSSWLSH